MNYLGIFCVFFGWSWAASMRHKWLSDLLGSFGVDRTDALSWRYFESPVIPVIWFSEPFRMCLYTPAKFSSSPLKSYRNPIGKHRKPARLPTTIFQGRAAKLWGYPPKKALLKMIFLFRRWDMLIPWRVYLFNAWPSTLEVRSLNSSVIFTRLWKKISVYVFSIKVLQLKHHALEVGRLRVFVWADLRILRSLDGRASSICAGAALLPRQTQRFHDSKRSGMWNKRFLAWKLLLILKELTSNYINDSWCLLIFPCAQRSEVLA